MPRQKSFHRATVALVALGAGFSILVGACAPAVTAVPPTETSGPAVSSSTLMPSDTPAAIGSPAFPVPTALPSLPSGYLRFLLAPAGNEAHYTVTEQLANRNFPSNAVGTTNQVSGELVIAPDGKIDSQQSDFKVNLTNLTSDSRGRDGYIQRNTLQTDQFPVAEFVPSAQQGLSVPLPTAGTVQFQLSGNLTIHGVTRPATWEVTAQLQDGQLIGKATTAFKFEDFGMQPPKAFIVLSVQDNIQLEYDFDLTSASPPTLASPTPSNSSS